jgi:hypothetical protein
MSLLRSIERQERRHAYSGPPTCLRLILTRFDLAEPLQVSRYALIIARQSTGVRSCRSIVSTCQGPVASIPFHHSERRSKISLSIRFSLTPRSSEASESAVRGTRILISFRKVSPQASSTPREISTSGAPPVQIRAKVGGRAKLLTSFRHLAYSQARHLDGSNPNALKSS